MGLLDSFNLDDPQTAGLLAAATGILGASGPSRMPIGLGQILGQGATAGMQAYQGAKKSQFDLQKEKMQLDMMVQQLAQATRKNSLINDMLAQYSGSGDQSTSTTSGAVGDGSMSGQGNAGSVSNATQSNGMPSAQGTPGTLNGVPRSAMAADLAFNDGKKIGEWNFQRNTPNMQIHSGVAFDLNKTQPGLLPWVNTSASGQTSMGTIDPKGNLNVSAPAGALDTYAGYQNADQQAKANFNIATHTPPGKDSLPTTTTQAAILDAIKNAIKNQGQPAQGARTQPQSAPPTPAIWDAINAQSRAQQPQRDNDRLAILNQELSTETDPANRAALQREIQRMGPMQQAAASAPAQPAANEPMIAGLPESQFKQMATTFKGLPPEQQGPLLQKVVAAIRADPNQTEQQKSAALTAINDELTNQSGTPSGQSISSVPGIQSQSPAQADAAKAQALADVALRTQPALNSANTVATTAAKAGQDYQTALHGKVEQESQLVQRNNMIAPYLDKFATGGFAPEERLNIGNAIANSGMLPDSAKQALGSWIAGGDVTSGKVIANQLGSAAISTMLQTLDGEGKPNRAIFQQLNKYQEDLRAGKPVLQQIFALQKQIYDTHYNEEQALNGAIKDNSYNPQTWQGDYSAIRNKNLSKPAASNTAGWSIKRVN